MLTRRSTVAAVALTLGILATPAAGKAPVCNLVRDPAGDDSVHGASTMGASHTLDIVSGDVATNRSTLTVVLRVSDLDFGDGSAPTGQRYSFTFLADQARFRLEAHRTRSGDFFSAHVHGQFTGANGVGSSPLISLGDASGVFDDDLGEVRIHVPVAGLRAYAPSFRTGHAKLTGFLLASYRNIGEADSHGYITPGTGLWADRADGGRASYPQGARSCVRVGR